MKKPRNSKKVARDGICGLVGKLCACVNNAFLPLRRAAGNSIMKRKEGVRRMEMSIAALSVGMGQQKVQQSLDVSVMKMAFDQMEDMGAMMEDMVAQTKAMELSAQPYLGANLDVLA